MLNFVNQPELNKLNFGAKIEGKKKIFSVTANYCFASRNIQNRKSHKKSALWKVIGVICKCWWNVFRAFVRFVFKQDVFLWLPEDEWKILSIAHCRTHWSRTVYHRHCSFLRCSQIHHFTIMENIPNEPNNSLKICSQTYKGYDSRGKSICCYSQVESKIDPHAFDI